MREGWRLAAERHYGDAVQVLRSIIQENPAMVEVWIKLGDVCAEAGRDDGAEAAYAEALRRSPVFLDDIDLALGFAQLREGRLEGAESAGKRALPMNPARAHELLTRVALARNRLGEAEAHAQAARDGPNPQPSSMLVLVEVALKKGDARGALELLNQVEAQGTKLRLGPVYGLEFLRGDALARLGRPREAESAYGEEITRFPRHAEAYSNLAVLRFLRGDRPAVERLLEEMVGANPSPRSYLLAAATWQAFGDTARAAAWRSRARTPS
jgi:tetratricopeptide (TPR) repeat protein